MPWEKQKLKLEADKIENTLIKDFVKEQIAKADNYDSIKAIDEYIKTGRGLPISYKKY